MTHVQYSLLNVLTMDVFKRTLFVAASSPVSAECLRAVWLAGRRSMVSARGTNGEVYS